MPASDDALLRSRIGGSGPATGDSLLLSRNGGLKAIPDLDCLGSMVHLSQELPLDWTPKLPRARTTKDSTGRPEQELKDCEETQPAQPDGGYGWVIVGSVFIINMINSGIYMCSGIYLPDFSDYFKKSQASMAFILAVETFVGSFSLMFLPMLMRYLGGRNICLLGFGIAGIGMLIGAYVENYYLFIMTFAAIKSVGASMTRIPANVIVQKYFTKRRALAGGLSSVGMSGGTLLFSPVHRLLINRYGWRGGLLVYAGIVFNGLVFSALLRPLHEDKSSIAAKDKHQEDKQQEVKDTHKDCAGKLKHLVSTLGMSGMCQTWVMVFIIGKTLSMAGVAVFYRYTVSNAAFYGIDRTWASFLPAIIGLGSTISRFLAGLVSNLPFMTTKRTLQYSLMTALNGVLIIIGSFATYNFWYHAICNFAYGLILGCHEVIAFTIVTDLFGLRRLSQVASCNSAISGAVICLILPLIGYLYDVTGDFRVSLLLAGGLQTLGGLVFLLLLLPTRTVTSWDLQEGRIAEARQDRPKV